MKTRFLWILSIAAILLSLRANAEGLPMRSIEDALEATNKTVTLPDDIGGAVFFRNCSACNVKPLHLTPDSRFFTQDGPITLVKLQSYMHDTGVTQLTIFHTPGTTNVTRIVAFVETKK